jgi:antitoxin component YwqK of YwqJK toxin-antitoxin module
MRNYIYLFVLSILLISCSQTYTNVRDLDMNDGKYTFNGEIYEGIGLSMTSKNKVREFIEFNDGIVVSVNEHSVNKGHFEEVELENGKKTMISDMIIYKRDLKFETTYYPDGSVERKTELSCEGEDLQSCFKNGKSEYYDEQGNVTEVQYYKDNKKVNK